MTTTLIEHPADTRRTWNRIAGFAGMVAGVVSVIGGTWALSDDPAGGVAGLGLIGGLVAFVWTLIASVFLIRSATD